MKLRSSSAAALAALSGLSAVASAGADLAKIQPAAPARTFHPAPSGAEAALLRSVDDARERCSAETERLCLRPRDPLEELFGGSSGGGLLAFFESDPFFRMAATPPSISGSPGLLDEVFGSVQRQEQQQQLDGQEPQLVTFAVIDVGADGGDDDGGDDDFADLARVLDGMMDSALRAAFAPPPPGIVIVAEERGEEEPRDSAPREAAGAKDPAAVALSALGVMVDGLLDHAASASASASADGSAAADEEEKKEEEEVLPNVWDAEVKGPSSKDPLHPTWDPVLLSRKIAQHGRDVLEDENKEARAGADGDLRRRRLTAEGDGAAEADVRGALARRLTEVVPFEHLSIRAFPAPEGLLVVRSAVAPSADGDESPLPRLGYGCQVDQCLWAHYHRDAMALPNACAEALGAAKQNFRKFQREVMGPVRAVDVVAEEGKPTSSGCHLLEYVEVHSRLFWTLWVSLMASLVVVVCICDDDEEEDGEAKPDASDYVLIEDLNGEADGCESAGNGAVAFVGMPLRVV